jgi:hypothetical protein
MGVTCPCSITEYVFSAVAEAVLGLSTTEIIACSSGRFTVAEASATEAGRIKLKARTIASRAVRSISLFFIGASYYSERLFNFNFPVRFGHFYRF